MINLSLVAGVNHLMVTHLSYNLNARILSAKHEWPLKTVIIKNY